MQLPKLLYLCTGNAARSVMATVITRERNQDFEVSGAGTFAIEGCPMGVRTRNALESIGLQDNTHRSRQLGEHNAREADLIVAMATEHVSYVRRTHPEVAHKTITLKRLARDFPIELQLLETQTPTSQPASSPSRAVQSIPSPPTRVQSASSPPTRAQLLAASLAQLQPEHIALQDWESIDDPGSGELDYFLSALHEIDPLVDEFLSKASKLFRQQVS